MKLNQSPSFNGYVKNVVVPKKFNKGREFLFNEVIDLTKEFQNTALVKTKGIMVPDASKTLLSALEKSGINYGVGKDFDNAVATKLDKIV